MSKLIKAGFLKKVQNGVYGVNPNVLMKGNEHKRQMLLSYYQTDSPLEEEITHVRTMQPAIATVEEGVRTAAITAAESETDE